MSFLPTSFKAPVILDGGKEGSHSKTSAPANSYDWGAEGKYSYLAG